MIEVYGKEDCGYCVRAKKLLELRNIPYNYYTVGEDVGINEILQMFPGVKTVPIIVVNKNHIGGYEDLEKYIEETANGYGDGF